MSSPRERRQALEAKYREYLTTLALRASKAEALVEELEKENFALHQIAKPNTLQEIEARVAELEHIEDTVLACQLLVDAGQRDEAIDRLLTIYVGEAMKRAQGRFDQILARAKSNTGG